MAYQQIVCILFLFLTSVRAVDDRNGGQDKCEKNRSDEKCRKFRDELGRLTMRCGVEDELSVFPEVDPKVEVRISLIERH